MNILHLFQNYKYFKIHSYIDICISNLLARTNLLQFDIFKIKCLTSMTIFWLNYINLSMIKTLFIFQTFTYSKLKIAFMVGTLQNKMVMHLASDFTNRYYLYDHALIFFFFFLSLRIVIFWQSKYLDKEIYD